LNILITGASGFLGSALAIRFVEMQHQVSLLVRGNSNLQRLGNTSIFKIGRCDTDSEISKFISDSNPDVIIHAASCYGRDGESYLKILDSNVRFGTVILNSIKSLEKKIVFVNSGTVLSENASFYAFTKIQFEKLASFIAKKSTPTIQFINIKLQHMYGPGDDESKFSTYVIHACKNNIQSLPLTFGEQRRDFIYIDDVVDAYVKILDNLSKFNISQKIELGSGVTLCLRDFVETVHRLTNSTTELAFGALPYRENDEMIMVANIELLQGLGWAPKFNLETGIKKIIAMESVK
jgi:CDP-paratose synthetase